MVLIVWWRVVIISPVITYSEVIIEGLLAVDWYGLFVCGVTSVGV